MALRGFSLEVEAGETVALLGPNGAGKSTLVKIITGLTTHDSGEVEVMGYPMPRKKSKVLRKTGVILEGDRNFYHYLSAWANMFYFGRIKLLPERYIKETVPLLLEELGLHHRKDDRVGDYSLGMKRKLALGLAVLGEPELLILDEPTLGLDVPTRNYFIESLKSKRMEGKTVLLCTHQMDVAQRLADRVAIINEGRLVAFRPTSALVNLFSRRYYEIRLSYKSATGASVKRKSQEKEKLAKSLGDYAERILTGFSLTTEGENSLRLNFSLNATEPLSEFIGIIGKSGFLVTDVSTVEPNLEEAYLKVVENNGAVN